VKTAYKRLLAIALAMFLVCALFYGCSKEPELPPETETEAESTEDPWAFETETTEEDTTEEETEPPTTTRRPTTTTRTTTRTTTTSTTTSGSTTIPDGSDKAPTTTTTTTTKTTAHVKVTNVKFNRASSYTLPVGNTQPLEWTVSPANATDKGVTFRSSNKSVAEVSAAGVVTAKGGGTCTITVTTIDSKADANYEDTVTISVPVVLLTSFSIAGGKEVKVGGSLQFQAHDFKPSNATNTDVTWSVSPAEQASINSSGVLTANQTGITYVTATAKDGSGASYTVSIEIKTP